MGTPFDNLYLRNWLFESVRAPAGFPWVFLEGSIPFIDVEFQDFLTSRGFATYRVCDIDLVGTSQSDAILIVGRDDYSEDRLRQVVDWFSGRHLRVYSQEMLLTYLASGKDPFDEPRYFILQFAVDHPTLQCLSVMGFDWPSTIVRMRGAGTLNGPDWDAESLLKYLGYAVGRSGIQDIALRQRILAASYDVPLAGPFLSRYQPKWGESCSSTRLKKMAEIISMECVFTKQRRDATRFRVATAHWEADLAWLKDQYYWGRHTFQWPDTEVR